MDLKNETGLPAVLIRGILREDELFGSLVARVTWTVGRDGRLSIAGEQPWEVSPGPWDGPAGPMPGDELFYRGGVDLFVLGFARAPGKRPVERLDLTVEAGRTFRHTLSVVGDRVWERRRGGLAPTPPRPFTEIPLSLAGAFGGKDLWDELPVPFPDNPDGKGFFLSEESAAGGALPNLEDPGRPVRRWDDRPDPVGTGIPPAQFGPRLRTSLEFDPKTGMLTRLDPTFFNHAFPGMVAPKGIGPGDPVRVTGVSPEGPLAFVLPPTPFLARVRIGTKEVETRPDVDQIGIEPDASRVFITYRYAFRYRLVPLEPRSCELLPTGRSR